ncbi:hypothetical protein, partial [Streptomyces sp. NPDC087437]|uniref:hypothetical protein n=1 Tax=Streptomyces sp. NPDC087437 TaxID=3365789 RepID=UPI003804B04D
MTGGDFGRAGRSEPSVAAVGRLVAGGVDPNGVADVGLGVVGRAGVAAVGSLAAGGRAPSVLADVVTATGEPSAVVVGRLVAGGVDPNGVADVGLGVVGRAGVAAVGS